VRSISKPVLVVKATITITGDRTFRIHPGDRQYENFLKYHTEEDLADDVQDNTLEYLFDSLDSIDGLGVTLSPEEGWVLDIAEGPNIEKTEAEMQSTHFLEFGLVQTYEELSSHNVVVSVLANKGGSEEFVIGQRGVVPNYIGWPSRKASSNANKA